MWGGRTGVCGLGGACVVTGTEGWMSELELCAQTVGLRKGRKNDQSYSSSLRSSTAFLGFLFRFCRRGFPIFSSTTFFLFPFVSFLKTQVNQSRSSRSIQQGDEENKTYQSQKVLLCVCSHLSWISGTHKGSNIFHILLSKPTDKYQSAKVLRLQHKLAQERLQVI